MAMEASYIWIVVLGFTVAFILALGLGANDVANSFGTSVGSKVLSLTGACIVATFCETSGAVLSGGKVTGGTLWLIIATVAKLPVSSTHSTVGAMMGFGLVAFGSKAIKWKEFGKIVLSWIVSPLMAGSISCIFYILLQYFVLNQPDSYKSGLKALPIIYFIILSVNIFAIFYNGSEVFHFNEIPLYGCLILSLLSGLIVGLVTYFIFAPYLHKKIDKEFKPDSEDGVSLEIIHALKLPENEGGREKAKLLHDDNKSKNYSEGKETDELNIEDKGNLQDNIVDDPKTARLLAFIQIVTASFASFAHGSNDVSNAIGPLVSLWLLFKTGNSETHLQTPIWILFYGGVGISVGLWIWGRRVIETIGENLSTITPSSGLIIEFGTVFTVLLASNLGIPISTTHCLVGGVILVGLLRSRNITDWRIFSKIVLAWLVTVPVSGCLAAATFAILRHTV